MENKGLIGSSLARKYLMGITGLFLWIFLVEHLSGNFLLFVGEETFNAYAEFMGSNPFIRAMEIVLFAAIIFHIIDGIVLTIQNRKARKTKYAYPPSKGSKAGSMYARSMKYSGLVLLAFLILHLSNFWFEARFGEPDSLYMEVRTAFEQWWYTLIYVIAMITVALHLNHGFQSAFQSLGLRHNKYTPFIKGLGTVFAIIFCAGFASIPIYFFLAQ